MRRTNTQRLEHLAHVASLYYDQNKTQQEIAKEIGVTRSAVSRLLSEARAQGLVEIIVHYPYRTSPELERALLSSFDLKAVRVLIRENKSYQEMLAGIGVLAAQYFTTILDEEDIVGISWGTGLYQMVRALHPMSRPGVQVIQLIGGTGSEKGSTVGPLLAPLLANSLGCACRYLHAPLMTESEASREALLQDRSIRETLELAERAQIALVGIGSTNPEIYNPYRLGYVNDDELREIRNAGAVGLVCGQHFTVDGTLLDIGINRRIVGISLKALSKVDRVIGVAGDVLKAEAILGALRGRYVNVLITDERAAQRVLELKDSTASPNLRRPG
jgi:DNA-binding transcriptional regulator LsrR (DeoR family)